MKRIFTVLPVLVLLMGCFEESDPRRNRGNEAEVIEYISKPVYDELKRIGFEMNLGSDPLHFGEVSVEYFPVLKASNRDVDEVGRRYQDVLVRLSEMDYDDLKIYYYESWGNNSSWTQGPGIITGNNNRFTVFVDLNFHYEGGEHVHMVKAFSGRLTGYDIDIYQSALYMVTSDESLNFIPDGTARVFENKMREEEPGAKVEFPLVFK